MPVYNRSCLQWRCRRGTKELDHIMQYYLDQHFDEASAEEQAAFVSLLAMEDPELNDWIVHCDWKHDNIMINRVLAVLR